MIITVSGRAQAGKDTIAAYLVERYGFVRVGFADLLKQMALDIDPVISSRPFRLNGVETPAPARLAAIVGAHGWGTAKQTTEVRRHLQRLGTAIRFTDEDFWVRAVLAEWAARDRPNLVIPDARYANELDEIENNCDGWTWMVSRADLGPDADSHASEHEWRDWDFRRVLTNDGTIEELHAQVDEILDAEGFNDFRP